MTADTITLKRTVTNEPSPRYYTMTGSDFATMKNAVAAAGGKFVTSPIKSWAVNKAIITSLKEAGYIVTAWPFLRQGFFNERTIQDNQQGVTTCTASFEYINKDGSYRYLPWDLIVIVGKITADMVAATNAQINADLVAIGLQPSPYLDRFTAVRKLAREAAAIAAADVVATFEAASNGKRDENSIKAGFEAVKAMLA